MRSWRIYHFHDTSAEAKVKQACEINDNRVFHGDASNLAAFLYSMKKKFPDHYRDIVDAVRMVAPFIDDFILEPLALNENMIRLEWQWPEVAEGGAGAWVSIPWSDRDGLATAMMSDGPVAHQQRLPLKLPHVRAPLEKE